MTAFRDGHVALSEPMGHEETFLGMFVENYTHLCAGFDTQRFCSGKDGGYHHQPESEGMCREAELGDEEVSGTGEFLCL